MECPYDGFMPLPTRLQRHIRSLKQKKFRDETGEFVAEGAKLVRDLCQAGLTPQILVACDSFAERIGNGAFHRVTEAEMARLSLLETPAGVLATFRKPTLPPLPDDFPSGLCLALDDIQNPGNLGSIVRTADWFGVREVFCGPGTADAFGPKAVQATMGSLARVHLRYGDLEAVLERALRSGRNVFGAFLEGESLFESVLPPDAILILGHEGRGINPRWEGFLSRKLTIPSTAGAGAESLNVGAAAAIFCAFFRKAGGV